jgi:glycylpeptide N-tetradecanoyltransferase
LEFHKVQLQKRRQLSQLFLVLVSKRIFEQIMSELVAEVDAIKIKIGGAEIKTEKSVNVEGGNEDNNNEDENDEDEEDAECGGGDGKKKKKKKKKKPKKKKGAGGGASEPCETQVHRMLNGNKNEN